MLLGNMWSCMVQLLNPEKVTAQRVTKSAKHLSDALLVSPGFHVSARGSVALRVFLFSIVLSYCTVPFWVRTTSNGLKITNTFGTWRVHTDAG